MFVASELTVLNQLLVDQPISDAVMKRLKQENSHIEATLLRTRVLRQVEQVGYIAINQENMQVKAENMAYLFAPVILANLNQKVMYNTPKTIENTAILGRYYNAETLIENIKIDDLLDSLGLYIQLDPTEFNEVDYFYYNLINSLSNSKVSKVICISRLSINQDNIKQLEHALNVQIQVLHPEIEAINFDLNKINMLKLLFKNKDNEHAELCQKYSFINAKLLELLGLYQFKQAQTLIEDMFYSEHIFEKLSVYGEYMQTRIQHIKSL